MELLERWCDFEWKKIGLAFAVVSLFAAFATIGAVTYIALLLISIFISFMSFITSELQALENGCPALGRLGQSIEVVAFIIGLFGVRGLAIGSWISFLAGGAIGGSVSVCKKLDK